MASKAKTFGYARVSSKDQNEDRQRQAFLAEGINERDIYIDKQSGKGRGADRPQFAAMIGSMREGDTLIICSLDRLGRDYTETRNDWRILTEENKVNIKVLDMPLLDTTTANGNLDSKFISELVLQILSYVAEKERSNIKERQRQGILAMPVENGKRVSKSTKRPIGRPGVEYPANFFSVYNEWHSGNITAVKAMEMTGLKTTSFYKLVKRYESEVGSK